MGVEFDADQEARKIMYAQMDHPIEGEGIVGWLVNNRIAKSSQSANKILVIVIIVCFSVAVYFSFRAFGPAGDHRTSAQIQRDNELLKQPPGSASRR